MTLNGNQIPVSKNQITVLFSQNIWKTAIPFLMWLFDKLNNGPFIVEDDPLMAIFGSLSSQSSHQSLFNSPKFGSQTVVAAGSPDLFSSISSIQEEGIDQKIDLTLQVTLIFYIKLKSVLWTKLVQTNEV